MAVAIGFTWYNTEYLLSNSASPYATFRFLSYVTGLDISSPRCLYIRRIVTLHNFYNERNFNLGSHILPFVLILCFGKHHLLFTIWLFCSMYLCTLSVSFYFFSFSLPAPTQVAGTSIFLRKGVKGSRFGRITYFINFRTFCSKLC